MTLSPHPLSLNFLEVSSYWAGIIPSWHKESRNIIMEAKRSWHCRSVAAIHSQDQGYDGCLNWPMTELCCFATPVYFFILICLWLMKHLLMKIQLFLLLSCHWGSKESVENERNGTTVTVCNNLCSAGILNWLPVILSVSLARQVGSL